MDAPARAHGFLVLYPEQSVSANAQRCWNWFSPEQSTRGQGEVAILATMIDSIASAYHITPNHIALVGMSAGAAMAANLMIAYPERYGALAMHSGIAALAATDVGSAVAIMRTGPTAATQKGDISLGARALAAMGSRAKGIPVVVIHGDADKVVSPANIRAIVAQFTEINAAVPGPSAPVEQHLLPGLGHAWSGGAPEGSYTAPGPDATDIITQFLRRIGVIR